MWKENILVNNNGNDNGNNKIGLTPWQLWRCCFQWERICVAYYWQCQCMEWSYYALLPYSGNLTPWQWKRCCFRAKNSCGLRPKNIHLHPSWEREWPMPGYPEKCPKKSREISKETQRYIERIAMRSVSGKYIGQHLKIHLRRSCHCNTYCLRKWLL